MSFVQVARMSGTGGQLYSALSNNRPSEAEMLKAQILYCECCPFTQVPHTYANYAIMKAFKGAQRVHIIDYGILYGVQWPCLLHQLSQREGGPPHLRITGMPFISCYLVYNLTNAIVVFNILQLRFSYP